MRGRRLGWVLTLAVAGLSGQTAPVTISPGRITGKDLGEVQAWLGIPYAAPPVGELRWKPPQAPVAWEGVRAMEHYGAICMQGAGRASLQQLPMSEDCLTLNVWAPKHAEKAAVMVWIHGGGFVEGSGALAAYAGTELARQGVVVVTINYRLGDFGLFALPALGDGGGSFALMDQVAALRWVKRNIAAFGGDPGNVTIFGESAGGSSVNFLMLSPEARGLFHKAIAESGGGPSRIETLDDLEGLEAGKTENWGASDAKALRALPASTILSAPRRTGLGAYEPVVDGKYVLDAPAVGFSKGRQAPVPFLAGANSFEASLMTMYGVTTESVLARVNREQVRRLYGDDPVKAARELFADAVFLGPARYLAMQMEKVKKPAYLYFFSYMFERRRGQAQGAIHAGEIPFVFDQFPGVMGTVASAQDRKMAAAVSAYWVQFAKTGNPNREGLPEWPAYTPGTDRLLELGTEIEVRERFRAERLNLVEAAMLRR